VRALVVLPTYQEAENIGEVLRRLRAAAPGADVLVVDDSSPDGTASLAKAVGHGLGGVDVLVRATKSGLGSAYRAGFAEGLARGYDVLVEMDSDLSHDPARLPALLAAIEDGAYRADALRRVDLGTVRADGYGFQIEMAYRIAGHGGSIVELPIQFLDRARGTSKMSCRIIAEALVLVTWWGVRDRLFAPRRPVWLHMPAAPERSTAAPTKQAA